MDFFTFLGPASQPAANLGIFLNCLQLHSSDLCIFSKFFLPDTVGHTKQISQFHQLLIQRDLRNGFNMVGTAPIFIIFVSRVKCGVCTPMVVGGKGQMVEVMISSALALAASWFN